MADDQEPYCLTPKGVIYVALEDLDLATKVTDALELYMRRFKKGIVVWEDYIIFIDLVEEKAQ